MEGVKIRNTKNIARESGGSRGAVTQPPDGPHFHCRHDSGTTLERGFLSDPAFRRLMNRLIGPPLLDHNSIETLLDGDNYFPRIFDLLRQARSTICIETYMWSSGEISDRLIEVLSERAAAGVRVHILSDGFGALRLKQEDVARMKEGGIEFAFYERARWHRIKSNLAHRTHRKVVVIDGRIGISGGFCIDDRWMGNGEVKDEWRDNTYIFRGPVVGQMQAVFADNWAETTSVVLAAEKYFPALEPEGDVSVQYYHGAPSDRYGSVRTSFFMGIAAAEEHVRIANAYFIPDDEALDLLLSTRRRGVEVEVIVPAVSDTAIGRAATRVRCGPLLEAGAKIYRYEPGMFHCKYMIVDDCWSVAGSANFDNRSFSINDESNFNVYGHAFAAQQIKIFEKDKARSSRYTVEDHHSRPVSLKAGDSITHLIRRFL
jgi:cardiolipin synthase A/B